MRHSSGDDYVRKFTEELVGAAIVLGAPLSELVEGLPEDEHPGEDLRDVVVDMVIEAVAPLVRSWGERAALSAASLVGCAAHRTLTDSQVLGEVLRVRGPEGAWPHFVWRMD
jgi:hypothetical protein